MKKSELYGYIGTVVSGIIILLLLFFVLLPGLKTSEDDGVMISFGDAIDGAGATEVPAEQKAQTSSAKSEIKEEMITQTDKSVVINDTKKSTDNVQSRLEDRYKKEQQASQQADDLIGGSFGGSSTAGSGSSQGDTSAGNPVGSGTSGGNSWSLNGRNLLGTIPTPAYSQNVEGYITVEIRVDASGNVTSASVTKSTISDNSLRKAATSAARRTHFSSGSGTVVGTITYNFKLK